MTPEELLETWQDEAVRGIPEQKDIVAHMIVHDSHPNVILDFGHLLFMQCGPLSVAELKLLIQSIFDER